MSKLPTEDSIRKVTDVKNLQDACIKLIGICQKESTSKKQYRATADGYRKMIDAQQLEIKSLAEKNQTLESITREFMQNNSQEINKDENIENGNDDSIVLKLKKEIEELELKIQKLSQKADQCEQEKKQLMRENEELKFLKGNLEKQIELLEERNKENSSINEKLRADISSENPVDDIKIMEQMRNDYNNHIQKVEQELLEIKSENQLNIKKINELTEVIQQKENEIQEMQMVKEKSKEECNMTKKELDQQKKLMENFEDEKSALVEIIQNNKTKAKEKIEKLKDANIKQFEEHRKEIRKFEEERERLQNQIESLNQLLSDFNNANTVISSLENEKNELNKIIEEKNTKIYDLEKESLAFIKQINEYSESQKVFEEKIQEIENLNSNIEELQNKIFSANLQIKEHEKSEKDIAAAIEERNSTIFKLKSLLSRSVKSDQRKQVQIDELQEQIIRLQQNEKTFDDLEKMKLEKEELEQRIKNSQASNDIELQNQKMQEMIDKSNRLYAQLLEENQNLQKQLSETKHFHKGIYKTFSYEIGYKEDSSNRGMSSITPQNSSTDFNEKSFQPAPSHKSLSPNVQKEAKLVKSAYLRRVLLQFFANEVDDERAEMIPIILELVGCTKDQTSAVMRQWERNQHLIARTAGFFGF